MMKPPSPPLDHRIDTKNTFHHPEYQSHVFSKLNRTTSLPTLASLFQASAPHSWDYKPPMGTGKITFSEACIRTLTILN